jgi:hypothetical protein
VSWYDQAHDRQKYDEWLAEHRDRVVAFAFSRGGNEDDVSVAIRRTIESEKFPTAAPEHWWSWHCSITRSVISTRRGVEKARAKLASLAIHGDEPSKTWPRINWTKEAHETTVHFATGELCRGGEVEVDIPARRRSVDCGLPLAVWTEREGDGPCIAVIGCLNGHRQYMGPRP